MKAPGFEKEGGEGDTPGSATSIQINLVHFQLQC